ncbi:MAG: UPF0175 family protein [Prosthecobacter sp.]|jgi:predicted HTH domain antitoxin|uniref:UPF0175 family protein n=1 Tax=Prosthecobacter sp. TaxID=1965333 RepID=UPI0019E7C50F|nr:UPF0175 family protein [Prosthecobacter sp.]MBE2283172.1 UPF0175 family protein [Prosthecobacter sp.]
MKLEIEIPNLEDGHRIHEPEGRAKLLVELACRLYEKDAITFGQGRELAGLGFLEFQKALAEREIPRMTLESFMLEINQPPAHAGH